MLQTQVGLTAALAELVMALVESIPDALLPAGEEGLETVGVGLAEWIGAQAQAAGVEGEELAAALDALWPWMAGEAAGFATIWPEAA